MKSLFQLFLLIFCISNPFYLLGTSSIDDTKSNSKTPVAKTVNKLKTVRTGLFLRNGMQIDAGGFNLTVVKTDGHNNGSGLMYFPALEKNLSVSFNDLWVAPEGDILWGDIQVESNLKLGEQTKAGFWVSSQRGTLPVSITEDLIRVKNYQLPDESDLLLEGMVVTKHGAFVDLTFSSPTIVEGDYLDFSGKNILIPTDDFCLEDVGLELIENDSIDDWAHAIRIVKGNPGKKDKKGSYVNFSCDGFKAFQIAAEYVVPRNKLKPALTDSQGNRLDKDKNRVSDTASQEEKDTYKDPTQQRMLKQKELTKEEIEFENKKRKKLGMPLIVPKRTRKQYVIAEFSTTITGAQGLRAGIVATATINPFTVANDGGWAEDFIFKTSTVVIDFSPTADAPGFNSEARKKKKIKELKGLVEHYAGQGNTKEKEKFEKELEAVEKSGNGLWQGIYIKEASIEGNPDWLWGGNEGQRGISFGIKDASIAQGTGVSANVFAANIFKATDGTFDGWGASLDTLSFVLRNNSPDSLYLNGQVFFPFFGRGESIRYNAAFVTEKSKTTEGQGSLQGATVVANKTKEVSRQRALVFALDIRNKEYHFPMLGKKTMVKLNKNAMAGIRRDFTTDKGDGTKVKGRWQAFVDLSGELTINIKKQDNAASSDDPNALELDPVVTNKEKSEATKEKEKQAAHDLAIPKLKFEYFKLSNYPDKAEDEKEGKKLYIKTPVFDFGPGLNQVAGAATAASNNNGLTIKENQAAPKPKERKISGFSLKIKKLKFNSISIGEGEAKQELKELEVNFLLQAAKTISLEGRVGIRGKVDYVKLALPGNREDAIGYHGLSLGALKIELDKGAFKVIGLLNFFEEDPIYGKGLKGGVDLTFRDIQAKAVFQIGTTDHVFKEAKSEQKSNNHTPEGPSTVSVDGQTTTVSSNQGEAENNDDKEKYKYWFVDIEVAWKKGIGGPNVKWYGAGGGFFWNMDKSKQTVLGSKVVQNKKTKELSRVVTKDGIPLAPGKSLSGSVYTPSNGSRGGSLKVIIGGPRPEIWTADAELSLQFQKGGGLTKMIFDGSLYLKSKSFAKRKDATVEGHLTVEWNLTKGLLYGTFSVNGRFPKEGKLPLMVIQGQEGSGLFQFDVNSKDNNEWPLKVFVGTPTEPISGFVQAGPLPMSGSFYVMIGDDLPPPVPVGSIHEAFKDIPESKLAAGNGFAFGYRGGVPRKDVNIGPIHLRFGLVFGFDASIKKYLGVSCSNSQGGGAIGANGWYLRARAYAAIDASVNIRVKTFFYKGSVNLLNATVAGVLQAELPNPTWVRGDLKVRASVLGGVVKVNKKLSFEVGEKCQIIIDPIAILANIKVINEVAPEVEEEAPSEEEAEKAEDAIANGTMEIWEDINVAFDRYIHKDPINNLQTHNPNVLKIDPGEGYAKLYLFPYLKSFEFGLADDKSIENAGGIGPLECKGAWNTDGTIYAHKPVGALEIESTYGLKVQVGWKIKTGNSPWKVVKRESGAEFLETKKVLYTTGGYPKVMQTAFLEPSNHFPGNWQRNYHPEQSKAEIHFTKPGIAKMFDEEQERVFDEETYMVKFDFVARVTDLESGRTKDLKIVEKPGDSSYESINVTYEKKVFPADTSGNQVAVTFVKQEVVAKNSKAIKFPEMSEKGFLERGKFYKFEILGIPRKSDETAEIETEEETIEENYGGIAIVRTETKLEVETNPFVMPETLYSFNFRTSKYESLKDKVDRLGSLGAIEGAPFVGSGLPKWRDITEEVPWEVRAVKQGEPDFMNIKDVYHPFAIDEGFDGWEREQLKVNLRYGDDGFEEYNSFVWLKNAASEMAQKEMPEVWKDMIFPNPWEERDLAYQIDFPVHEMAIVPDEHKDAQPGYYPALIQKEIDDLTIIDMTKRGGESTVDPDNFSLSTKWDMAIVSKRRRLLQHQLFTMQKIHDKFRMDTYDWKVNELSDRAREYCLMFGIRELPSAGNNIGGRNMMQSHLWNRLSHSEKDEVYRAYWSKKFKDQFGFNHMEQSDMYNGGQFWKNAVAINAFNSEYNKRVITAEPNEKFKFYYTDKPELLLEDFTGSSQAVEVTIKDKAKITQI